MGYDPHLTHLSFSAPTPRGRLLHELQHSYVAFDIETTGLTSPQVIEIGAVKVVEGKVVAEREIFVAGWDLEAIDYGHPTPFEHLAQVWATAQAHGRHIDAALTEFSAFAGDAVLLGHNLGSFDIRVLNRWASQLGQPLLLNNYADTLALSRRVHPHLPNHKLSTLTGHYRLGEVTHTALSDAHHSHQVYQLMGKLVAGQGGEVPQNSKFRASGSLAMARQQLRDDAPGPLNGMHICVTGDFPLERQEVWNLLAANGANPISTVSRKATHLLLGDFPTITAKQRKAEELGLPILSWAQLQAMLAPTA
jgi:DNA polymerase-3 subunit epsilon